MTPDAHSEQTTHRRGFLTACAGGMAALAGCNSTNYAATPEEKISWPFEKIDVHEQAAIRVTVDMQSAVDTVTVLHRGGQEWKTRELSPGEISVTIPVPDCNDSFEVVAARDGEVLGRVSYQKTSDDMWKCG